MHEQARSDEPNSTYLENFKQDEINGFSEDLLGCLISTLELSSATALLDGMAGDGNLTERICEFCTTQGWVIPKITVLELSSAKFEQARRRLSGWSVSIMQGDICTMQALEAEATIADCTFDRVVIKSGNHEIPLEQQLSLYQSIYRVLKPGGLFINLGFVLDDDAERDELAAITRVKDRLIGALAAVRNRHFLTRTELYERLEAAGFLEVRSAARFSYEIRSSVVQEQYFSRPGMEQAMTELQASQACATTMRRNGRIRFELDTSTMSSPGEITVARRPTWAESNALAFQLCPYDFLRQLECHAALLSHTAAHIPAHADLLDLGCGPGLLAERLVDKEIRYQGIDISPEFIAKARSLLTVQSLFQFRVGDLMREDFGPSRFDRVTLLNVLYLPGMDALGVLKRAFAALRPGGRIVVSGPTSAQSYSLAEPHMRAQLERDGRFAAHQSMFQAVGAANARLLPGQGNYWSIDDMARVLREVGFRTIVAQLPIYYGHGFMVVAEKQTNQ